MIIGSYVKLDVGMQARVKLTDNKGEVMSHWQNIIIVREATRDEYLAQCEELGGKPNPPNQEEYFYKVLTD